MPTSAGKPMPVNKTKQALEFAEGKNDIDTTRLNANIRVSLHRKLKSRAALEGRTMGELIEEWIEGLS